MSTRVLCPTCLREETWSDGDREVHQPGGSRQPAVPPMLAAWDTLRAARAEGRAARGVCVCGQPLVDDGEADAAHPPIPWTLTLPDGTTFTVAESLTGPDGEVGEPELTKRLEAVYPRRFRERPHILLFQAATLTPVVVAIFTLWLMAATSLMLFLRAFAGVDVP